MRAQFARPCVVLLMALLSLQSVGGGNWHFEKPNPCDCDFDWQWFAPVHDYCCEPNPPAAEGYFFEAERSHWWLLRPDRKAIGNPGVVPAWVPNSVTLTYQANPGQGNVFPIVEPAIGLTSFIYPVVASGSDGFQFNTLDDAISETSTGWGERLTFGHVCEGHGWMISVTPEVKITQVDEYGFDDKRLDQLGAAQGLDGIDGVPTTATPPTAPVAGSQAILPIDGLTTVPVLFNVPALLNADGFGLLDGFRDENGDGVPDLNTFPVRIAVIFDDLRAAHEMRVTSVELNLMQRKQRLISGYDVEAFLGARYFEMDDRFAVTARGGVLADTNWDHNCENRIVGPQIGFRFAKQSGRWTKSFQSRFVAGANFLTIRQDGVIGSHLPVGFPGVPQALGGNSFFHRVGDELFSPIGELRFDLGCQLTRHVALKFGWNGLVAGGIARATNTVRYDLPALGIQRRQEDVFAHSVSFGCEINR